MIKEDLHKLLFLDIETVGIYETSENLKKSNPDLYDVWESTGVSYFKRHYSEDNSLSGDELFYKYSALLPEFGKIVCVSVGFLLANGEKKLDSFYGDERELLTKVKDLLNRVDGLGFSLCGHNIKNFDLPYLGKRMLINGVSIPKILPDYKVKPWETKVLDTKEVWNFNAFKGLSSLQLACACLGIKNPKNNEVNGSNMHIYYYNTNNIDKIKDYCEEDVKTTIDLLVKINEL